MNTTAMIPYEKLNSLLNHVSGFDGRKKFGGGAVKLPLDAEFVQGLMTEFFEFVGKKEAMNESLMLFEMVPYKKVRAPMCKSRDERW